MKKILLASVAAVMILALMFPCVAAAAEPDFDTDYLNDPEKYRCTFTVRTAVDETEDHYVVGFLEYVYRPTGNARHPEELLQNRTLTYTFDNPEQLAGQPEYYVEKTEYPDGWSNTYIGWQTKFSVGSDDTCGSEDELIEHLKETYLHADRGETCEEVSIGGRRGLKITLKARTTPAPLHDSVTQFDESVKYIMILESPVPHSGFAYIVVGSVAHGAATHYSPMKTTTEAQLNTYYKEYVSRFDTVINALCGAKFTMTQHDVWVRTEVQAPVADEDKADRKTDIVINTDAEKTAEESGLSIPAAVVVGVLGAGAAAAGAGAAAAGDTGDSEVEQGDYTMLVGKDFGNAIKLGKKQRVWARMAEEKNGALIERPDLTQAMTIFSDEILVGAAFMQGANMTADVQIQENAPTEGIISFLYTGEHGSFQNNVRFRLLGKGEIRLAQNKVNILSTDPKPFELPYALVNFTEEEPPIEITSSSGLVRLDIGKDDKDQPVVLVSPGSDAEPWDHKRFAERCRCEIEVKDGQLPVRASFEVTVCFEGIGTAYETLSADEVEAEALIECFTDSEKEKREEKALWVPLTVMKWDEKRRVLEPDAARTDALQFTYEVHPEFEFKTPESKALAGRVVAKAKLDAKPMPAPVALKMDKMKKPETFRFIASDDPKEGAAPFDIRITATCDSDRSLEPLLLKVQLKPNPDFKGMVRWFLEYPLGSAVADFITLGNVTTYHGALDFVENRVYPSSGVPWSSNLLWLKSKSSHYETGRGDIMRKSYIAIKDDSFPRGIGEAEFKKVQTLVHELTHVIEDQHGDYNVDAKSESHAYYLQHLSDLAGGLADIESPGCIINTEIQRAIQGAYWHCKDPLIVGDLSDIGPWFGGKFSVSIHELFDKYAYHIDTLGGKMDAAHRAEAAQRIRHWYFPGNLSDYALWNGKNSAFGYFIETDGPFKGAEWKFNWSQGMLMSITLTHSEYMFKVEGYYWTGGNELKLQMKVSLRHKDGVSGDDYLSITLDGGTYNMAANYFPEVRSFSAAWRTLNDSNDSLLFKMTGFPMERSWVKRKK